MCKKLSLPRTALGVAVVACALVLAWSCDDDGSGSDGSPGLSDLAVQVIEGHIFANLQPVVPPDPVICALTLRITNNAGAPQSGLFIPSASVFLSRNSAELGMIRFQTAWDGSIGAGATDTVVVTKIQEEAKIFEPPCGEAVYLRVRLAKSTVQFKTFSTPSYGFSCPR